MRNKKPQYEGYLTFRCWRVWLSGRPGLPDRVSKPFGIDDVPELLHFVRLAVHADGHAEDGLVPLILVEEEEEERGALRVVLRKLREQMAQLLKIEEVDKLQKI